jgi:hypothetical protein
MNNFLRNTHRICKIIKRICTRAWYSNWKY